MEIIFATSNVEDAFNRIKKILPSYEITKETCFPILDLVKKGHIRIGDPMMYGNNIPIYPDENYCDQDSEIINKWMVSLSKIGEGVK